MDLRQLSHGNHIKNNRCAEYTGPNTFGRYCSMSGRHLFSEEIVGIFSNYNIDVYYIDFFYICSFWNKTLYTRIHMKDLYTLGYT